MCKHSTGMPHPGRRPSLTLADGLTLWRARDVYRLQNGLYGLLGLLILGPPLMFLTIGRWDLALITVGMPVLVLWGGRWLLRRAWRGLREWWHGLVLALAFGVGASGCTDMV